MRGDGPGREVCAAYETAVAAGWRMPAAPRARSCAPSLKVFHGQSLRTPDLAAPLACRRQAGLHGAAGHAAVSIQRLWLLAAALACALLWCSQGRPAGKGAAADGVGAGGGGAGRRLSNGSMPARRGGRERAAPGLRLHPGRGAHGDDHPTDLLLVLDALLARCAAGPAAERLSLQLALMLRFTDISSCSGKSWTGPPPAHQPPGGLRLIAPLTVQIFCRPRRVG